MLARWWWGLIRFGFRLLYNEMAFTYDGVSKVVSLGAWRCWQRASLDYLPEPGQGLILELAHGTGDLQLDLHSAGYSAIGYDLSPYMGRIASRKLRRRGLKPRFARGQAQALPFADQTFRAVVSTFPTDFIVAPETLHEVYRVLEPGGCLVIVPNGVLTGGGTIRTVLEWLYRVTGQRSGQSGTEATSFFEGYGFTVEQFEVSCPHSVAQVIRLRKPDGSQNGPN